MKASEFPTPELPPVGVLTLSYGKFGSSKQRLYRNTRREISLAWASEQVNPYVDQFRNFVFGLINDLVDLEARSV